MSGDHTPLLDARGIEGGYRGRQVLRGVDLRLEPGEIVALLGPNGAGKTTFMKMVVGLIDQSAGTIDGPTGRAIGWVPQGGATYARLTVRENLELFARLMNLPVPPRAAAAATIRSGDLQPWTDTPVSELSGGLRQRLNIAVGLLGDPQLLVLDEPTTGVDLVHRTAMFTMLRERSQAGCGVLYSTHSLEDASVADRIVVVVGGRVVYDGSLEGIADAAEGFDTDQHPYGHVPGLDPISTGLLAIWQGGDDAS